MSILKRKSFNDPIGLSLPKTGEEYVKLLEENSEFEEIPGRIREKTRFVSTCNHFANYYEYKIKIKDSAHEVIVDFEIEGLLASGETKEDFLALIGMADEIGIFNLKEQNITLSLTFYTHQIFLNGRPIRRIKGDMA